MSRRELGIRRDGGVLAFFYRTRLRRPLHRRPFTLSQQKPSNNWKIADLSHLIITLMLLLSKDCAL